MFSRKYSVDRVVGTGFVSEYSVDIIHALYKGLGWIFTEKRIRYRLRRIVVREPFR